MQIKDSDPDELADEFAIWSVRRDSVVSHSYVSVFTRARGHEAPGGASTTLPPLQLSLLA